MEECKLVKNGQNLLMRTHKMRALNFAEKYPKRVRQRGQVKVHFTIEISSRLLAMYEDCVKSPVIKISLAASCSSPSSYSPPLKAVTSALGS